MKDSLQKLKSRIVQPSATVLSVLKKMDESGAKSLLVLDNKRKFLSIVSIGDIQRAIIRNEPLDQPISNILRSNPKVGSEGMNQKEAEKMMVEYRMEFLPVVNEKQEIVHCYFWEDLFPQNTTTPVTKFDLPVVVMAGGKGTRLKPLTNVLPKPLIPIGDKSMLEEIFDRFALYGCNQFYVSVNYKAELIEYYLNQLKLPYNVELFREHKPLGTAGSLCLLKNKINQTFFVTNCDILIQQDYAEILEYHQENNNEITIVAALKHYPIPYGILETGENGSLLELTEKPELTFKINSGMYILEPHLLEEIPQTQFFHITELIEKIKMRNGNIGVFPVSEKSWKDVGDWKLYQANLDL